MNISKRDEFRTEPNEAILKGRDGVEAVILRSTWYGSLSGFIGVPKGHPAYRNEDAWNEIDIHGKWTSLGTSNMLTRDREDLFWMAFHCNQEDDYKPYREEHAGAPENYRNLDFVKSEIERARDQLLEMSLAPSP